MLRFAALLALFTLAGCDALETAIAGPEFKTGDDLSDGDASPDANPDAIVLAERAPDAGVDATDVRPSLEAAAPDASLEDDAGWCSTGLCGTQAITSADVCLLDLDGGASITPTPAACRSCPMYTCACVLAAYAPPCAGGWGCSDSAEGFGSVRITCE